MDAYIELKNNGATITGWPIGQTRYWRYSKSLSVEQANTQYSQVADKVAATTPNKPEGNYVLRAGSPEPANEQLTGYYYSPSQA